MLIRILFCKRILFYQLVKYDIVILIFLNLYLMSLLTFGSYTCYAYTVVLTDN